MPVSKEEAKNIVNQVVEDFFKYVSSKRAPIKTELLETLLTNCAHKDPYIFEMDARYYLSKIAKTELNLTCSEPCCWDR